MKGREGARDKLGMVIVVGDDQCAGLGLALTCTLVLLVSIVEITEVEELLSRKMMKYWTNFTPNG